MKIVVIASFAPSFVNFRYELLQSMVRSGHEVIALAPNFDAETKLQLEKINVRAQNILMSPTGLNPISDWKSYKLLRQYCNNEKPGVVFTYTIKPVIYGSLAARSSGVKNIFSLITGLGSVFIGDKIHLKLASYLAKKLYKAALRSNRTVFFQNPDDKQFFISSGLIKESQATVVNGSGVNVSKFTPSSFPLKLCFTLVARLIKDKGVIEFVRAAEHIKRLDPRVCFKIIGPLSNNPSAISSAEVAQWKKTGVIEYLGAQKDIREQLAQTSVFVLPSYREGLPRSSLEAMAMGRPIITTDAPGCRETVIEGKNGFLVPVKNVEHLITAMTYFLDNPEMIKIMGEVSRSMVEDRFDVGSVNKKILGKVAEGLAPRSGLELTPLRA